MKIVATEERGGNSIAIELVTGRSVINMVDRVAVEETNSVRAVLRIESSLGGVPVVQRPSLCRGLKPGVVETTLDWPHDRLMKLEQLFPYCHPEHQTPYALPSGCAP